VLLHPLLAHRVGLNFEAETRHWAFFRLAHARHAELRPLLMQGQLWAELEGMQLVAARQR
jgi:hypothetical protein